MTDLKPDNTLYDSEKRKAIIIDLGGAVKVFNIYKYIYIYIK